MTAAYAVPGGKLYNILNKFNKLRLKECLIVNNDMPNCEHIDNNHGQYASFLITFVGNLDGGDAFSCSGISGKSSFLQRAKSSKNEIKSLPATSLKQDNGQIYNLLNTWFIAMMKNSRYGGEYGRVYNKFSSMLVLLYIFICWDGD